MFSDLSVHTLLVFTTFNLSNVAFTLSRNSFSQSFRPSASCVGGIRKPVKARNEKGEVRKRRLSCWRHGACWREFTY